MKLGIIVDQDDHIKMMNAIREICPVNFRYDSEWAKLYFQIEDKFLIPIAQLMRDRFSNARNIMSHE